MKNLKITLTLILLITTSVFYGQTKNIYISTPFYKSGLVIKPIIQDGILVQLKVSVDGAGDCVSESTLRIQFTDMTFLLLDENLSSNEDCNSVTFDITAEHNMILKKTQLRKMIYINRFQNKSIAGTPANEWYFTHYIPHIIKEFSELNI